MTMRVYRMLEDEGQISEEYLGEYLSILPITYQNAGEIRTDPMVYYIQDDGSVGTENRINVLIKHDKNNYYPNKPLTEDDILEGIDEEPDS